MGIGVATNVRVSNSIGAQQLPVARRAAALGFALALLSTVATALLLLVARRPWASLFTADAALIDGVTRVVLVAAVYVIADGTTCALGGCLQGCGRQGMAGWVVVFSYYAVGLPLASLLGFQQKWGVVGLTSGLCVGSYVHCLIYAGMVLTTNWELQVYIQPICASGMLSGRRTESIWTTSLTGSVCVSVGGGMALARACSAGGASEGAHGAQCERGRHRQRRKSAERNSGAERRSGGWRGGGCGPREGRAALRRAAVHNRGILTLMQRCWFLAAPHAPPGTTRETRLDSERGDHLESHHTMTRFACKGLYSVHAR